MPGLIILLQSLYWLGKSQQKSYDKSDGLILNIIKGQKSQEADKI